MISTKTLKRTLTGLLLVAWSGFAFAENDDGGSADATPGSLKRNSGHAVCTAAINSDGTIAGGNNVSRNTANTRRITDGQYEVRFFGPCREARARDGAMRFVQVDTLSTGSLPARVCTTADRSGDSQTVFVICYDSTTGTATDTSFMLMVTK